MNQTAPRRPTRDPLLPEYAGAEWLGVTLPTQTQGWPNRNGLVVSSGDGRAELTHKEAAAYVAGRPWVCPSRETFFLCDIHADADAFAASLVASGGVRKTGPGDTDIELTDRGQQARFIIGGDCFDKGPSTLRLLRALRALVDLDADVVLLAGNHDLRALLGMLSMGRTDARHAHLFTRMGKKIAPLIREVWDDYLEGTDVELVDEQTAADRLFPPPSWYHEFPQSVAGLVPPSRIDKELRRIEEKTRELQARTAALGLTMPMVEAAARKCVQLFSESGGEFAWYFEKMDLAFRDGSCLFVHGGVDDHVARVLAERGVRGLNADYKHAVSTDLFELYNGPLGNCFRTKYREGDWPLSLQGLRDMRRAGLYAVVHGHRNVHQGQRLVIRRGLLNFECDSSVDCNTRNLEGLRGCGAAVTILRPDGHVIGISVDYPYAKVFHPAQLGGMTTRA